MAELSDEELTILAMSIELKLERSPDDVCKVLKVLREDPAFEGSVIPCGAKSAGTFIDLRCLSSSTHKRLRRLRLDVHRPIPLEYLWEAHS